MKAIRVHEFGGPEVLKLEEVGTPKPSAGEVLVCIFCWDQKRKLTSHAFASSS
jgi:hypothetical protein